MQVKSDEKDLFGHTKKRRRPRLESTLIKHDRDTLQERLSRLRHLQTIFPHGFGFLSAIETALVFDEAKMTYLNGEFVATILLAQAHIEHRLQSYVASKGKNRLAKRGLAEITKFLRAEKLLHDFLLDRIDRLRSMRNPFTHLQIDNSEHSLSTRAAANKYDFAKTLQRDAEFALALMYEISVRRF